MPRWIRWGWAASAGLAVATRLANALGGPLLHGYDAIGHLAYVFFLDLYHAVPYADQGWSFFHPPLHYALGWGLAQSGSADVLARGLLVWNSLASLGVAALAAWMTRLVYPGRPALPLLAFSVVAFVPVHVYASTMPGNEPTAALLCSAALVHFLARERRDEVGRGRDGVTGLLLGAALLAKYSALVTVAAIAGTLLLGGLRERSRGGLRRSVGRLAVMGLAAGLLCGPYYARNVATFGTPFPLAGHRPVVDVYEAGQPPGARGVADLVRVSPRLLVDPDPRAEHMLHSIWGTLYAATWVHEDRAQSGLSRSAERLLLVLGLVPTLLGLFGGAVLFGAVARERSDPGAILLVLLTAAGLAAALVFAFGTPTFAALKALYLLQLSVAAGCFVAVGVASWPWRGQGAIGLVAAIATAVAGLAYTRGVVLPVTGETLQMAVVRSYFGEFDAARAIYDRERAALEGPVASRPPLNPLWLIGMQAGVEMEAGAFDAARALYAESAARRTEPSLFTNHRLAVATALAGEPLVARRLLDAAIAEAPYPELRASRAALHAILDDADAADAELRAVLAERPDLAAAWASRAALAARRGDPEAAALRAEAQRAARRAPRGYPYAAGDGRGLNSQLYMLVLEEDGLALYRPARAPARSKPERSRPR